MISLPLISIRYPSLSGRPRPIYKAIPYAWGRALSLLWGKAKHGEALDRPPSLYRLGRLSTSMIVRTLHRRKSGQGRHIQSLSPALVVDLVGRKNFKAWN